MMYTYAPPVAPDVMLAHVRRTVETGYIHRAVHETAATDGTGAPVPETSPRAVAWSLAGAIGKALSEHAPAESRSHTEDALYELLDAAAAEHTETGYAGLEPDLDTWLATPRTQADALALLDRSIEIARESRHSRLRTSPDRPALPPRRPHVNNEITTRERVHDLNERVEVPETDRHQHEKNLPLSDHERFMHMSDAERDWQIAKRLDLVIERLDCIRCWRMGSASPITADDVQGIIDAAAARSQR